MTTVEQVLGALAGVRDPELDEPLTELGFVARVRIEAARVEVRLRLPTYFCAPNFAWLMVDGARSAVLALDGVDEADVRLGDHVAAEEINGAASVELHGELTELRDVFVRKAFVARQARLCEALLRAGWTVEDLAAWRLSSLDPGPEVARCVELREQLGISASPEAPAFVLPGGEALDAAGLKRWLRLARVVRLSIEGNAGICRGLLKTRYGIRDPIAA
jgi:metal-sulfur cluster biosynthetic enzyme